VYTYAVGAVTANHIAGWVYPFVYAVSLVGRRTGLAQT